MQRKTSFSAAAVAVLICAGPALSAETGKPSFDEADKDGNGMVSEQEARDAGFDKYQFAAQDVDQDGELTKEDWRYISRRSNFVLYDVQ